MFHISFHKLLPFVTMSEKNMVYSDILEMIINFGVYYLHFGCQRLQTPTLNSYLYLLHVKIFARNCFIINLSLCFRAS